MNKVYGYIRVSDKKQKEGVSLVEQKRIIIEFATKNNLEIIHFYEENKTAAKRGRPLFTEMMRNLVEKKASGVIMHKIDRSARNLHDWAMIGDLIDKGISVNFAHESINMNERGGRLSADIQAVMASDYVRNLRQESIKGLYGRLKQGIYPFSAPTGYVNQGKGKLKTIHPVQGELVKQTFKLYATGEYNVRTLAKEMEEKGLINSKGNRICKNSITVILKNPFYIGLMRVKEKTFKGKHKPLVTVRQFKQAQLLLKGRTTSKGLKHSYTFRRKIRCENCNYILSGERQKGNIYYRCQTKGCETKTIREDTVNWYVENMLRTISLSNKEVTLLKEKLNESKKDWLTTQQNSIQGFDLQIRKIEHKQEKLLDGYLDSILNKEDYEKRNKKLLLEIQELSEKKETFSTSKEEVYEKVNHFIELCKSPLKLYQSAISEERREMLETITSNFVINRKKVMITMVSPFIELSNRDFSLTCPLERDTPRTMYTSLIYMDKNTSSIVPKSFNKQQINDFFQFLLQAVATLSLNKSEYDI